MGGVLLSSHLVALPDINTFVFLQAKKKKVYCLIL